MPGKFPIFFLIVTGLLGLSGASRNELHSSEPAGQRFLRETPPNTESSQRTSAGFSITEDDTAMATYKLQSATNDPTNNRSPQSYGATANFSALHAVTTFTKDTDKLPAFEQVQTETGVLNLPGPGSVTSRPLSSLSIPISRGKIDSSALMKNPNEVPPGKAERGTAFGIHIASTSLDLSSPTPKERTLIKPPAFQPLVAEIASSRPPDGVVQTAMPNPRISSMTSTLNIHKLDENQTKTPASSFPIKTAQTLAKTATNQLPALIPLTRKRLREKSPELDVQAFFVTGIPASPKGTTLHPDIRVLFSASLQTPVSEEPAAIISRAKQPSLATPLQRETMGSKPTDPRGVEMNGFGNPAHQYALQVPPQNGTHPSPLLTFPETPPPNALLHSLLQVPSTNQSQPFSSYQFVNSNKLVIFQEVGEGLKQNTSPALRSDMEHQTVEHRSKTSKSPKTLRTSADDGHPFNLPQMFRFKLSPSTIGLKGTSHMLLHQQSFWDDHTDMSASGHAGPLAPATSTSGHARPAGLATSTSTHAGPAALATLASAHTDADPLGMFNLALSGLAAPGMAASRHTMPEALDMPAFQHTWPEPPVTSAFALVRPATRRTSASALMKPAAPVTPASAHSGSEDTSPSTSAHAGSEDQATSASSYDGPHVPSTSVSVHTGTEVLSTSIYVHTGPEDSAIPVSAHTQPAALATLAPGHGGPEDMGTSAFAQAGPEDSATSFSPHAKPSAPATSTLIHARPEDLATSSSAHARTSGPATPTSFHAGPEDPATSTLVHTRPEALTASTSAHAGPQVPSTSVFVHTRPQVLATFTSAYTGPEVPTTSIFAHARPQVLATFTSAYTGPIPLTSSIFDHASPDAPATPSSAHTRPEDLATSSSPDAEPSAPATPALVHTGPENTATPALFHTRPEVLATAVSTDAGPEDPTPSVSSHAGPEVPTTSILAFAQVAPEDLATSFSPNAGPSAPSTPALVHTRPEVPTTFISAHTRPEVPATSVSTRAGPEDPSTSASAHAGPEVLSTSISAHAEPEDLTTFASSYDGPQVPSTSVPAHARPQVLSTSVSAHARPEVPSTSVSVHARPQVLSTSVSVHAGIGVLSTSIYVHAGPEDPAIPVSAHNQPAALATLAPLNGGPEDMGTFAFAQAVPEVSATSFSPHAKLSAPATSILVHARPEDLATSSFTHARSSAPATPVSVHAGSEDPATSTSVHARPEDLTTSTSAHAGPQVPSTSISAHARSEDPVTSISVPARPAVPSTFVSAYAGPEVPTTSISAHARPQILVTFTSAYTGPAPLTSSTFNHAAPDAPATSSSAHTRPEDLATSSSPDAEPSAPATPTLVHTGPEDTATPAFIHTRPEVLATTVSTCSGPEDPSPSASSHAGPEVPTTSVLAFAQVAPEDLATSSSPNAGPSAPSTPALVHTRPEVPTTSVSAHAGVVALTNSAFPHAGPSAQVTTTLVHAAPEDPATPTLVHTRPDDPAASTSAHARPEDLATPASAHSRPKILATFTSAHAGPNIQATSISDHTRSEDLATPASAHSGPEVPATSISSHTRPEDPATSASARVGPENLASSASTQAGPEVLSTSISFHTRPVAPATSSSAQARPAALAHSTSSYAKSSMPVDTSASAVARYPVPAGTSASTQHGHPSQHSSVHFGSQLDIPTMPYLSTLKDADGERVPQFFALMDNVGTFPISLLAHPSPGSSVFPGHKDLLSLGTSAFQNWHPDSLDPSLAHTLVNLPSLTTSPGPAKALNPLAQELSQQFNYSDVTASQSLYAFMASHLLLLVPAQFLSSWLGNSEDMVCLQPMKNAPLSAVHPDTSGEGQSSIQRIPLLLTLLKASVLNTAPLKETSPSTRILVKPGFVLLPSDKRELPELPPLGADGKHAASFSFTNKQDLGLVTAKSSHGCLMGNSPRHSTITLPSTTGFYQPEKRVMAQPALSGFLNDATIASLFGFSTSASKHLPSTLMELSTTKQPFRTKSSPEKVQLPVFHSKEAKENNSLLSSQISATHLNSDTFPLTPPPQHSSKSSLHALSTVGMLSSDSRISSLLAGGHSSSYLLTPGLLTKLRSVGRQQLNTELILQTTNQHRYSAFTSSSAEKRHMESLNLSSAGSTKFPLKISTSITPSRSTSLKPLSTESLGKPSLQIQFVPRTVSTSSTLPTTNNHKNLAGTGDFYSEGVMAHHPATQTLTASMNRDFSKLFELIPSITKPSPVGEKPVLSVLTQFSTESRQINATVSGKLLGSVTDPQRHSRTSAEASSQIFGSAHHALSLKDSLIRIMAVGRLSLPNVEGKAKSMENVPETNIPARQKGTDELQGKSSTMAALPGNAVEHPATMVLGNWLPSTLEQPLDSAGSTALQRDRRLTSSTSCSPSASPLAVPDNQASASRTSTEGLFPVPSNTSSGLNTLQPNVARTNETPVVSQAAGKDNSRPGEVTAGQLAAPTLLSQLLHLSSSLQSRPPERRSLEDNVKNERWHSSSHTHIPLASLFFAALQAKTSLAIKLAASADRLEAKVINQSSLFQVLALSDSEPLLTKNQTQFQPALESSSDSSEVPMAFASKEDSSLDVTDRGSLDQLSVRTEREQVRTSKTTEDEAEDLVMAVLLLDSSPSAFESGAQPRSLMQANDVLQDGFAVLSDDACGSGNYTVQMSLRPVGAGLHKAAPSPQTFLAVVTLQSNGSRPTVRIHSCCVTPTARPEGPDAMCCLFPRLPVGCRHIQLLQNNKFSAASFTVQLFQMLNHSTAYLHCKFAICLNDHAGCEQNCYENRETIPQRSDRSSFRNLHSLISVGPVLEGKPGFLEKQAEGPSSAVLIPIVLGSLTGVAVLGSIFICLWLHVRCKTKSLCSPQCGETYSL